MILNVNDWSFLNEGGAHIVFASTFINSSFKGMVLRIPKKIYIVPSPPPPFPSLSDPIKIIEVSFVNVKNFIQHFNHLRSKERLNIPLEEGNDHILSTIMPNYHYNPDYKNYFSIELKPKWRKNLNLTSDSQTEIVKQIYDLKERATNNLLLVFKNGIKQSTFELLSPSIISSLSFHISEWRGEFCKFYNEINEAYSKVLLLEDDNIMIFRALLDCTIIFRGYYDNEDPLMTKALFQSPKIIDYDLNKTDFAVYKKNINNVIITHQKS